ncbi:MAG: phosphoribosylformimino-5-aminoimidazole carboxamide ribotide isomerase [Verrucomicrobiaceae bacterium]|nr:phosphoribosylformimino-5-aminoimidazole carboxamide ribotide isomerase [Verrucomicrobiaceae bacterium]
MTLFRPCIDLHDGCVKQIVGSSLRDDGSGLRTNFVSDRDAAWYAQLYQRDGLRGGHVILLGKGNDAAAQAALEAYPGGLQVGGGMRPENAASYLEAGASHVIVTSYLFDSQGIFEPSRLDEMVRAVGRERLVIDLSCKTTATGWTVAMNRWQTLTTLEVTPESLRWLGGQCAEFLIHAVDVEGKCEGIDEALVSYLGEHSPVPMTYAGGIRHLADLCRIQELSGGRVDGTVGSALDLFGGSGARYEELVAWNRRAADVATA